VQILIDQIVKQETGHDSRNRANHNQPSQPLVKIILQIPISQGGKKSLDQTPDLAPKKSQQSKECSKMKDRIEGQIVWQIKAEQIMENHQMGG